MKIIILILTINLMLFASLEKAQILFEAKEYSNVIEELKKSYSEYNNPALHLLWAKSAKLNGDIKGAMSAYERVLLLDETDTQAKIELLQIYIDTRRDNLAKIIYKSLEDTTLTDKQKKVLEAFTSSSNLLFSSKFNLAIGYDSNLNGNQEKDIEKVSTLFETLSAKGSLYYELQKYKNLYTRANLNFYNQNNLDASYYNLALVSVDVGLGYRAGKYNLYFPIAYDRIYYMEQDLLSTIRINPNISLLVNNSLVFDIGLIYSSKSLRIEDYSKINDTIKAMTGALFFTINKDNMLILKTKYEDYSSDKRQITNSIVSTNGLPFNIKTRLSYLYRYITNDGYNSYNKLGIQLSYLLKTKYKLSLSSKYIKNSSDDFSKQYSKYILEFGFGMSF